MRSHSANKQPKSVIDWKCGNAIAWPFIGSIGVVLLITLATPWGQGHMPLVRLLFAILAAAFVILSYLPTNTMGKVAGDNERVAASTSKESLQLDPPAILPAIPDYVGRAAEIDRLVGYMTENPPKPSVVIGGPGTGKSTITIAASHDPCVARQFGARRYFVRLDSAMTAFDLVSVIAIALQVEPVPDLRSALLAKLAESPALLVLDNFETPWDNDRAATESFISETLRSAPRLSLCVSTRGESYPGAIDWNPWIEAIPLDNDDSKLAFLSVTDTISPDDPDLSRLLHDLDGGPLAIDLLARRSRGETNLKTIVSLWRNERTRLLLDARITNPTDLDNKRIGLNASCELLIHGPAMNDSARRFLSVLAILPDGVANEDILSVFGDAPGIAERAALALRSTALAFDDGDRLRLLAPIREYVNQAYAPTESDWSHAAAHYLEIAALGETVGGTSGNEAVARLIPEVQTITSMIEREIANPEPNIAIDAAINLADLFRFTGLGRPELLDRAARRAVEIADPGRTALALRRAGDIALHRGEHEAARKRYEEALPLYRKTEDVLGEANCICGLGDIALHFGEREVARKRYDEALALYREVRSCLGEANCIRRLGDIAFHRSEHAAARKSYEEALRLYRETGDLLGEANCVMSLGDVALQRGDNTEATRRYEEAFPLYERVSEQYSIGHAHGQLAAVSAEPSGSTDHIEAVRQALLSAGRQDLIDKWLG